MPLLPHQFRQTAQLPGWAFCFPDAAFRDLPATLTLDSHLSAMSPSQPRNPLHGITLEQIVTELSEGLGWEEMGRAVPVRCFTHDPSISSSLKFLRRTPWARAKVEELYLKFKGG